MCSHRPIRFRNVLLLALVLLLLAPATASAQEPPPNRIFFPLVMHGTTCEVYPRFHVIFIEAPGVYFKVSPTDPTGHCAFAAFYRYYFTDQNGNSQWGPVTDVERDVWLWMPRVSDGETRHLLQFTGINYSVDFLKAGSD